ncbi:MAG TPA: hypothetical protein VFZ98_05275 [Vicinamibacterales bacterium]
MEHICLAMPVLAGKSDAACDFFRQLDAGRRAEFDASERRIGITKELWYLAKLAAGDHVIGYMETNDFNRALQSFVASRDPFDMWFKQQLLAVTGLDLNNPPANMTPPELLSCYEATPAHA